MRENKKGTPREKVICPKCGESVERLRISELYKCCFSCSMELLPISSIKDKIEIQSETEEKVVDIPYHYGNEVASAVYINAVAIDLIKKGYRIFIAYSPIYPYQLVAVGNEGAKRVKVISRTSNSAKALKGLKEGKYKHIATVTTTGKITYNPEIPTV